MKDDDFGTALEFIERMGLATEAEGLPRIAGRIFAFMLIDGGPCTFDDFVERLRVSRGSVSTNTRLLETLGVIERFTKPGERHDYFRFTNDPFGRLIERSLERMKRIHQIVGEARRSLPAEMDGPHSRLATMHEFYDFAIESAEVNLEGWRERRRRNVAP